MLKEKTWGKQMLTTLCKYAQISDDEWCKAR